MKSEGWLGSVIAGHMLVKRLASSPCSALCDMVTVNSSLDKVILHSRAVKLWTMALTVDPEGTKWDVAFIVTYSDLYPWCPRKGTSGLHRTLPSRNNGCKGTD